MSRKERIEEAKKSTEWLAAEATFNAIWPDTPFDTVDPKVQEYYLTQTIMALNVAKPVYQREALLDVIVWVNDHYEIDGDAWNAVYDAVGVVLKELESPD